MIREINSTDFDKLGDLYTQLHHNKPIEKSKANINIFNDILNDKNHHIIVVEKDGKIVSSCVCVIVLNLTHNQQPYAIIENVITDKEYRKQGLASRCLEFAKI